ncbi:MAG: hypothetical protein SPL62_08230, partial [Selenomonas sp.]|nr:hypothetical protein [Selenomonas sp.]
SWDSCTSWPSFETLPTMNALSDYLTKSGREESGGLLGAYAPSSPSFPSHTKKILSCESAWQDFFVCPA